MADEISKSANRERTYVSLSVAFVCIVVGVPLWWKTTQVYRASLPYSDIQTLADERTAYSVHVKVVFFDDKLEYSEIAGLQENLALELNKDRADSTLLTYQYKVFSRFANDEEKRAFSNSKTVRDLDLSLWRLDRRVSEEYYLFLLPSSRPLDAGAGTIGTRAGTYLVHEARLGKIVEDASKLVREVFVREGAVDRAFHTAAGVLLDQTDRDMMRSLRSEPAYDVTLTLLNVRPDLVDTRWDVKNAIQAYLDPFLDTLSPFVNFHIKSQVLYYVDLPVQPFRDEKSGEFYLRHDDLPSLINPIERELVSFTSTRPHINFVVYVAPPDTTPLYIRNQKGERASVNAFLSPRWGGMMVANLARPGDNETSYPVRRDVHMKEVMEILVTQLRLLVGLEGTVTSSSFRTESGDERAISHWELSYWLRKRTLENCGVATSALSSLAELLDKISNIVINDQIAQQIRAAIEAVRKSRTSLMSARISDAFISSRQALVAAETAFFDQSLLELLYFPDDQKFAIYIPLFLPISLPVLLSMLQAFKWLRQSAQEKQLPQEKLSQPAHEKRSEKQAQVKRAQDKPRIEKAKTS